VSVQNAGVSASQWHHVVCVFNDAGYLKLYVDGASAATPVSLNGDAPYEDSSTVFMGGYSTPTLASSSAWVLSVDEFRVYNYALTSAEVGSVDKQQTCILITYFYSNPNRKVASLHSISSTQLPPVVATRTCCASHLRAILLTIR